MTEHRTIEEGYQSATNSGNLAVDLEHRTDADWMIASGWSHRQLGADLMRLQSEWSSPNRQKNKRHDEANVRESIRQLRSLPKTQEKLIALGSRYGLEAGECAMLVLKVLVHWLDDTCHFCGGRGFDTIRGTPKLSAKRCKACNGSGKRKTPDRQEARRMLAVMDEAVMLHRDFLRKCLRQHFN